MDEVWNAFSEEFYKTNWFVPTEKVEPTEEFLCDIILASYAYADAVSEG
jgi:hypothetical protein